MKNALNCRECRYHLFIIEDTVFYDYCAIKGKRIPSEKAEGIQKCSIPFTKEELTHLGRS